MPLVHSPEVSSVGKSMYPIVAKVGQDEMESDSYSKRQMSHARASGVIAPEKTLEPATNA